MTTETGASLKLSRVIPAPADEVFRAWTDPEEMKEWFCPEGGTVDEVEVDLTVGGRFKVAMRMPNGVHVAEGVYREIERPRRVVMTWGWEGQDDETLLTLVFESRGDGTEVVLTHERFATEESRDSHEHGWSSMLEKLERRHSG
jgi:uncharacterized protein YndB with AHSA1/START domain